MEKHIKIEHAKPSNKDWFVVNWCLGNTCNYSCSYCPSGLHNSSKGWPHLDTIKAFISKVKIQHPNKQLYFEFTGGEVTLYRDFIDVCKFCTDLGVKVGLISNGSRTLRWWEENIHYFNHICLSFHPEFSKEDHFVEVIKLVHENIRTHVNIMMSPEKFDLCYAIANSIKDLGNLSLALQPLIHDFGSVVYDYTPEQQHILEKQSELITKHIKFTKHFDYYRGAMRAISEDGSGITYSAHRFISENANNWNGWKCYAGVEQLIVDMDGTIHRGWCKVGGVIGNINDSTLMLPADPVICNKTMCHCNYDIMSTKEKI